MYSGLNDDFYNLPTSFSVDPYGDQLAVFGQNPQSELIAQMYDGDAAGTGPDDTIAIEDLVSAAAGENLPDELSVLGTSIAQNTLLLQNDNLHLFTTVTASNEAGYFFYITIDTTVAGGQTAEVLLLDEWLAGLNPTELSTGIDLIHSLRSEGCTIILVEHVMDAIRSLCDRCVVMSSGAKIAEGTPAEVLAEPEVIRAYLGADDA